MTEFVPDYTRAAKREKKYSELHVSGRGKAKGKPDMFSISFRIEHEEIKKETAYDMVTEETEKLLAALNKWAKEGDKITSDDLSITQYRTYDAYGRWRKGQLVTTVSTRIEVVSPRLSEISEIIDLAVKSGACETYGVNYFLSDEAKQETRAKALRTAVLAARFDAECAAEPLGIILLGTKSVNVSHDWEGYYDIDDEVISSCNSIKCEEECGPAPRKFIQPDDVEVSVSVEIVFVYDDIYARNGAEALNE
ncbi:MAG TPA: SIMPL domain-containing protein [Methanocorpusculum sp.]|nr:SIMPL domain-containing protein [Methanocorpusculum sp.]